MLAFVLQILGCLLLAALIGFVTAWLLRGLHLSGLRQQVQQLTAANNTREPSQHSAQREAAWNAQIEKLKAEAAEWRTRAEESDAMRQATLMRISSAESMLQERNDRLKVLTAEHEKLAQVLAAVDAEHEAREQERAQRRGDGEPQRAANEDAARVQAELSSTRQQLDDLERKLAAAETSVQQVAELRARVAELDVRLAECSRARQEAENRLAAITRAEAEKRAKPPRQFAERPAHTDDLELIHGVGPVLCKLLNSLGIWQFRQVALWDEADIDFFDARLEKFHGRIRRERWVTSAAEQHYKKYGERIASAEPKPDAER